MKLASASDANKVEDLETEPHNVESLVIENQLGDERQDEVEEEEEEEDEDDVDFSFVCLNPSGSPISAEDAFCEGQIRPVYPLFNLELLFADTDGNASQTEEALSLRAPLRKVFLEKRDSVSSESDQLEGVPQGTYCEWAPGTAPTVQLGKKSNSTGFSKLWRFRDLIHRSSSDGKDAFVFLSSNPAVPTKSTNTHKTHKEENSNSGSGHAQNLNVKGKQVKGDHALSSAHERHYVRNRAKKEVDKRRSYLPYRQDLVGFFTNVNGLTKNVHPF